MVGALAAVEVAISAHGGTVESSSSDAVTAVSAYRPSMRTMG